MVVVVGTVAAATAAVAMVAGVTTMTGVATVAAVVVGGMAVEVTTVAGVPMTMDVAETRNDVAACHPAEAAAGAAAEAGALSVMQALPHVVMSHAAGAAAGAGAVQGREHQQQSNFLNTVVAYCRFSMKAVCTTGSIS
jgi:hypothetical protein